MSDPIQGTKLAMQSLQGVGQGLDEVGQSAGSKQLDGPSFQDVLGGQQIDPAQAPQRVDPAQAVDATPPAEQIDPAAQLDDFVKGVFQDEAKIEEMMARCTGGQTLSQGELLQLQGLIYGYAQKIELASKVVDKATGGLKQVMNTQV